jgi:hypothetical protein
MPRQRIIERNIRLFDAIDVTGVSVVGFSPFNERGIPAERKDEMATQAVELFDALTAILAKNETATIIHGHVTSYASILYHNANDIRIEIENPTAQHRLTYIFNKPLKELMQNTNHTSGEGRPYNPAFTQETIKAIRQGFIEYSE